MRIVYFGTAEFAVPALQAVAEHVVLVVSQPDRPSGRGMKLRPSPVKEAALSLGLPVETPEKARSPEFVDHIRSLEADFLLVAAYGQILSEALLNAAKHGGINLHGSVLPRYRGAAPIQRAIEQGESETGVTLMQMDRWMDTGDIIDIRTTPIGANEMYGELQTRLAVIASEMADEWLEKLARGDYPRTPQDPSHATYAPKIAREETELDLNESARDEYDRFRAFTPSPGAWIGTAHGRLKVLQARFSEVHGSPGQIVPGPGIAFWDGSLRLLEVQPEGKPRMSFEAFLNGARLKVADQTLPFPI